MSVGCMQHELIHNPDKWAAECSCGNWSAISIGTEEKANEYHRRHIVRVLEDLFRFEVTPDSPLFKANRG